jgi:GTPase
MEKFSHKIPLVVIFGRTNVGKSTLFNTLSEKKRAIVSKIEGTTRDANIGMISWQNADFTLVDTGGILDTKQLGSKKIKTGNPIDDEVQIEARDLLSRADLVLFLVDAKIGIMPQDKELVLGMKKLLKSTDKIVLVANKTDSAKERNRVSEFYRLSLGNVWPISSLSGSGTGDLLDEIVDKLKNIDRAGIKKNSKILSKTQMGRSEVMPAVQAENDQRPDNTINVSIVGKPNVGKSSLLNSILGYKRVIVSPIPHTTREPQDTLIDYEGRTIKLVDTAGISRKFHVKKNFQLEKAGISKSLKTLERSDIALFVIDINEGFTLQESKIAEEILERNCGLVIIANKWDLIKNRDTKEYTNFVRSNLPFATWAPIQFVSALTGDKVKRIIDLVLEVYESRNKEIADNQLDKFMKSALKKHRPAIGKNMRRPYLTRITQIGVNPPRFQINIGAKDEVQTQYLRYLENQLRDKFKLTGTPVIIKVVKRSKKENGKSD